MSETGKQPSHAEMQETINEIRRDLEFHIAEVHAHVHESVIQEWDQEIIEKVDMLGTAVLGPMEEGFDGPHRVRDMGMDQRLEVVEELARDNKYGIVELKDILTNGIKTRLALSDRVWVAIIGALAMLGAAYLGG